MMGVIAEQILLLGTPAALEVAFENIVFLAGWNGIEGQTSYTDESGYAHVASSFTGSVNTAELDDAQKVFGTTSLALISTARVTFPHHAAFNIGLLPFCFEFRVRLSSVPSVASLLAIGIRAEDRQSNHGECASRMLSGACPSIFQ